jgi:hypothetical protein
MLANAATTIYEEWYSVMCCVGFAPNIYSGQKVNFLAQWFAVLLKCLVANRMHVLD